ncbi:MAG: ABC transporter ATP-binding protein, partial [Clostridia bacterium]|nr:ABC transporter ATP-binding protein [Clostridia bacterium]
QYGRNFSGGQRQRLAITRALVGDPEILIFDDSSSALDYATDAALRDAVAALHHEHTTFIVSQRTSSIMHADKILVLEDGALIGMGTHNELYETCPAYKEIHDLQFKSGKGEQNNG